MKKISIALFLALAIICIGSCEKDDICVDGDTPLLVIAFYDINDTTATKNVPSLRVGGQNQVFTVNTITDRTDLDSIGLPLRVNETSTTFHFIKDSEDDDNDVELGNTDVLTFTYENKEVFVSRACGFIANFDDLSTTLTPDSDNWIQDIVIADTIVKNQAAAHVKIYH